MTFNPTRLLFWYVPIAIGSVYIGSMALNVEQLATKAYSFVSSSSSTFYGNMAVVSVALMGFLIVALPLIGDAFSKEKLGRFVEEFYEKGGVVRLLDYLMYTIALTALVFALSSVIYLLQVGNILALYVLVSTLMMVSLVYLGGSLFIMYQVIQSARPSLRVQVKT